MVRMSSACARRKLGGRRVKDFASCFFPRRISLEEERANSCSKQLPITSNIGVGGGGEVSRKTSHKAAGDAAEDEEDYIVFCFGEDGEIHIINSSQAYNQHITRRSSEAATCMTTKGDEKNHADHSPNPSKMDSCHSNLSHPTTSSFAFPILGMEWIGSPVQMPNTENCSRF